MKKVTLADGGTVEDHDENDNEGILLSFRLTAITLGLVIATAILASATTLLPLPEQSFTPEQQLAGTLAGFVVGWVWLSIALVLAVKTTSEFHPPLPDLFAALGVGMMLVFNGVVFSDPLTWFVVRSGGVVLLILLSVYTARELLRHSTQNQPGPKSGNR